MIERSTSTDANGEPRPHERRFVGWLLFPLSLFPLAALMTYDWRSSPLNIPAEPSSNWIGATGDAFAYWGYLLFGLALWVVPVACVIVGLCLVAGRISRPWRRTLWATLFLLCAACLMQVAQGHAPGISALLDRINVANAGGAVGYLVMSRLMTPLLSDVGASIIASILMAVSLVAVIGVGNIAAFFVYGIDKWKA